MISILINYLPLTSRMDQIAITANSTRRQRRKRREITQPASLSNCYCHPKKRTCIGVVKLHHLIICLCLLPIDLLAQISEMESLHKLLRNNSKEDTTRVQRLNEFSLKLSRTDPDEASKYADSAIILSKRLHYPAGETTAMLNLTTIYTAQGNYVAALTTGLAALAKTTHGTNKQLEVLANLSVAHTYQRLRNSEQALPYAQKAFEQSRSMNDNNSLKKAMNILGTIYATMQELPTAINYYQQARQVGIEAGDTFFVAAMEGNLAEVYELQGKYDLAFKLSFRTIQFMEASKLTAVAAEFKLVPATAYLHTGKLDSALVYAQQVLQVTEPLGIRDQSRDAHKIMSEVYARRKDYHNAWTHLIKYQAYRDSLSGDETTRQAAVLNYQIEQDKQKNQIDILKKDQQLQIQARDRQRLLLYVLVGGLGLLALLAIVMFRNIRLKQRANKQLQELNNSISEQKEEIAIQRDSLESTLSTLKSTQAQLIQSEKMASLGELTAGIAHEIQNPLNFVNNFSELSSELLDEMHEELNKGDIEEAKVISADIKLNLEKINHHGKRADAIVKGMLQHSRSSSGQKEPTDINALADEYLRLSYHGLRAKEKSFNATLKTEYDETIGKINIIPQDIGRVLLNLITNAFHAVSEKKQHLPEGYEPTVSVRTKSIGDKIFISVHDNGNGIPQKILDKIFQPFFTTKPTGQGTGLGLSLAYDIVKAHSGTLTVETKEGEGTAFIIQLPDV